MGNNIGSPNCLLSEGYRSQGYNLDSDGSCLWNAAGDRAGIDPLLGPLQDNGGYTLTHLPMAGSPVVNIGNFGCSGSDQRGLRRPRGAACDMGAVEAGNAAVPAVANLFNLDVGNRWEYRDNFNNLYTDEVTALDGDGIPNVIAYTVDHRINQKSVGTDTIEVAPAEVVLWGGVLPIQGRLYHLQLTSGLPIAWYPMRVGTKRIASTQVTISELPIGPLQMRQKAEVLSKEVLVLPFGRVNAYKLHYNLTLSFRGIASTFGISRWVVPNLGMVAMASDLDAANVQRLSAFLAHGRMVNQTTDYDRDGVRDFRDNCLLVRNVGQVDANHNDIGDACE
jgi:hypothetical protein